MVISAVAVLFSFLFMAPVWAVERQTLRNHVPTAVRHLQPVSKLSASKSIDLSISLPLRNREILTNLLQQIYDPTSTNYHRYLTSEQFAQQFGPTEKDYQTLLTYLKSQGLAVTGTHPNRTLVDVNGGVGNIEKVFQIGLRTYQHPTESRTFYAPDTEPSFDRTLSILSVSGLDNYVLPRPMNLKNAFHRSLNATPHVTGSGPRGNFIGKDFRAAYAPGVTLDGSGQAVGLFELDGYFPGDIAEYEALTGLPNVTVTNVLLNGRGASAGLNNVEVALDIEMVISMAPALSKVIVYEGNSPNDVLNRMATDNQARQLSCSWGFGSQVDAGRDQIFQQFAAQGQSMFQASGDLGAWSGAIFPPSDNPFITVVGGTSLTTTNPSGAWTSETAWPLSGGGISTTYALPAWQQGIGIPANQGSTTMRNIPDVACLADSIIWIVANNGEQGVVGGTSASAPLWAGFTALVNQQAAASGKASVGFINPAIYAIGKRPDFAINFHDVVSGNNTNSSSPNKFFAVTGYDLCTGWGTPNGSNLISALLGPPDSLLITPATIVTAMGAASGPFNPAAQNYALTTFGELPVNWSAANSSAWLDVSPTAGTIATNSPATVTFSLNSTASNLLAGSYVAKVWFTNLNNGFAQSRQFILNIITPPIITTQPSNQTVLSGAAARFAVGTAANAQLSYQWQRNGTNITNSGNISGSDTSVLAIADASPVDAGIYAVIVSNALNSVTSSEATLTVLPTTTPEVTMATLYSFTGGTDGANPNTLMQSTSGDFYGTTQRGGLDGSGTVFKMPPGGVPVNLHSFSGQADGAHPQAALVQSMDGNLYGTTFGGGLTGNGTVFKMGTNGLLTSLVSFNITNGDFPYAGLTFATDGNLYGTTSQGGNAGHGTAFKMNTNGVLSTLVSFVDVNGGFPHAGLIQGMDGSFYGTTFKGGNFDGGIVFKMTTNGTLTTLVPLSNIGGAFPYATLLQDESGNFYGTVAGGGSYNNGTIFKISPAGVFTNLHSFTGGSDGAHPFAGLIQGTDGNFYGTTPYGGDYGYGTVFRISADGRLTNLVEFNGYNGANPITALTQGADGNLYGTTQNGGATDQGVIFRLHLDGPLQVTAQPASQTVYSGTNILLSVATSGGIPLSYQWQMNGSNLVDGGNLFGPDRRTLSITNVASVNAGVYSVIVSNSFGSVSSDGATVQVIVAPPLFTMQPTNQTVTPGATVTFNAAALGSLPLSYHWQKDGTNLVDGARISGSASSSLTLSGVIETNNGIYSVVVSNHLAVIMSSGATLSVIPVSATGTRLAVLHSFSQSGGGWQPNGLMRANDGDLYGTTASGSATRSGAFGTIFKITTNGQFTALLSFTGNDEPTPGFAPLATLVQDTNGNFYGTTQNGGTNGAGNIFKLAPDYTYNNLYSFIGESDGYAPAFPLLLATDGNLYGSAGDVSNGGIFRITPSGQFTTFHSFTDTQGTFPVGALCQAADGNFYGMSSGGGAYGYGTVFKITPEGTLTNFYSFSGGPDGFAPVGALVQGTDGNLYGVTKYSSTNLAGMNFQQEGTALRITTNGALTLLYTFGPTYSNGTYPSAGLILSSDGNFYGTTYGAMSGGLQAGASPVNGTVFRLAPNGTLTTLVAFDGIDGGAHPNSALVEGPDGAFYGTTTTGGTGARGTIFKLSITSSPLFTSQPASQVVASGGDVMFSVAISGAPQLFYQWQKNGTNLSDGPNISGSATRILFLNNVSLSDAGNYSVTVSNTLGSVMSTNAYLTIIAQPVFQSIRMTNGTLRLDWRAMAGQRYQVQFNANLASINWINFGSIINATNDTVTATDIIDSSAQRFYRVVLLP